MPATIAAEAGVLEPPPTRFARTRNLPLLVLVREETDAYLSPSPTRNSGAINNDAKLANRQ